MCICAWVRELQEALNFTGMVRKCVTIRRRFYGLDLNYFLWQSVYWRLRWQFTESQRWWFTEGVQIELTIRMWGLAGESRLFGAWLWSTYLVLLCILDISNLLPGWYEISKILHCILSLPQAQSNWAIWNWTEIINQNKNVLL